MAAIQSGLAVPLEDPGGTRLDGGGDAFGQFDALGLRGLGQPFHKSFPGEDGGGGDGGITLGLGALDELDGSAFGLEGAL